MQDNHEPDPAAIWWNARHEAPLVAPPPIDPPWRWSWSPFIGIKYGPIPVGLFVAIPLLIAYCAR
jgi:hypothetical protein